MSQQTQLSPFQVGEIHGYADRLLKHACRANMPQQIRQAIVADLQKIAQTTPEIMEKVAQDNQALINALIGGGGGAALGALGSMGYDKMQGQETDKVRALLAALGLGGVGAGAGYMSGQEGVLDQLMAVGGHGAPGPEGVAAARLEAGKPKQGA